VSFQEKSAIALANPKEADAGDERDRLIALLYRRGT
jgi:hypothetical protein